MFSLTINTGELMMIGAIVVWGCYTIIARRLDVPAIAATAVQVVMATVTLAPFALAVGVRFPDTPAEGGRSRTSPSSPRWAPTCSGTSH